MLYSVDIYPPPGVMGALEQIRLQNQCCSRALAYSVLEKRLARPDDVFPYHPARCTEASR
jgi:hypothetical protein